VISAAKIKTQDRVLATLSLKNIVGAPVKDLGFRWGPGGKPVATTDKPIVHGNGFHGIHYNLYALASKLRPDLAVIDGYQAMEGNGPVGGRRSSTGSPSPASTGWPPTGWPWRSWALTSRRWDPNYFAAAGMGEAQLDRMEILGARVSDHVRKYRLADNVGQQLEWMKPLRG